MWEDNAPALRLFLAASSQWRMAGHPPRPVAMDYAGVEAAARLAGIDVTPPLFADLRIMEAAALRAMAERRRP